MTPAEWRFLARTTKNQKKYYKLKKSLLLFSFNLKNTTVKKVIEHNSFNAVKRWYEDYYKFHKKRTPNI